MKKNIFAGISFAVMPVLFGAVGFCAGLLFSFSEDSTLIVSSTALFTCLVLVSVLQYLEIVWLAKLVKTSKLKVYKALYLIGWEHSWVKNLGVSFEEVFEMTMEFRGLK